MEQRANIKFCVKLGKTFSETLQMLRQAYGEEILGRTQVYEWHRRFKNGEESDEDGRVRSGRPKVALKQLSQNGFLECFQQWYSRWQKCVAAEGHYFEGGTM